MAQIRELLVEFSTHLTKTPLPIQ